MNQPNIAIDLIGVHECDFNEHVQKHSVWHTTKYNIAPHPLIFYYNHDDMICAIEGYLPNTDSDYSIVNVEGDLE